MSQRELFAMRRASSENVRINIVCTHCGMELLNRRGAILLHPRHMIECYLRVNKCLPIPH